MADFAVQAIDAHTRVWQPSPDFRLSGIRQFCVTGLQALAVASWHTPSGRVSPKSTQEGEQIGGMCRKRNVGSPADEHRVHYSEATVVRRRRAGVIQPARGPSRIAVHLSKLFNIR